MFEQVANLVMNIALSAIAVGTVMLLFIGAVLGILDSRKEKQSHARTEHKEN